MDIKEQDHHEGEPAREAPAAERPLPEFSAFEEAVLRVLEHHDGLCMDEESERFRLAGALAKSLC
jgi:hypothetical protein